MPFKIIQTKERGKFTLTIIPEKWEQNTILYWPKRKVEELLEQESSCPDDSWLTMKCQVKRTGLISKQNAEAELANMLQESDTETEGSTQTSITKLKNDVQHYFDEIASTYATDKTTEAPNEEKSSNNIQANSVVFEYLTDIPQTSEQVTLHAQNDGSQTTEAISNILAITSALQQNQQIILDYLKNMENTILHKLSFLSAQVDTIAEHNYNHQVGEKAEKVPFKIISNKEDLNSFEQNLENPKYRADIKNQLSSVCGKGKGRGLNNAYVLADVLFTRHFLTQCSWGGGSKKEISKLCFKSFTKTVELFFSVIHESDADYTRIECESFFKNIMRHSVSRNKQNIKRAASSRRRTQKQTKIPTSLLAPTAHSDSSTNTLNNIVELKEPAPTVANNNSSLNHTSSLVAPTQQTEPSAELAVAAEIGD